MRLSRTIALFLFSFIIVGCIPAAVNDLESADIRNLVLQHAKAWETGDYELLNSILHENMVFAYPGRRLNKSETLKDLIDYNATFNETKIYINKIIIEGNDAAIEWQFASTNIKTGNRTAVSDAIIGRVQDGKIIVWKEYLDGRVSRMQIAGNLSLEEGEEPFPWPRRT